MTGLQKLANALDAFDVEKEVETIIRSNTHKLEDLQREQLEAGKDAQGGAITWKAKGIYSPLTIARKQRYGQGIGAITDHFTLYSSGELYKKLATFVSGNALTFKSSVPYFNQIIESAGDVVTGLNEESRKEFYETVVLPQFKQIFEAKTGIKLSS